MNNIIYVGPFKVHIQSFVKLKKAVGYKYQTEEGQLKRFDQFTLSNYPKATALTKEIVFDWSKKRSYEAYANRCSRVSIIREFARYLDSIGIHAYILPKRYYSKGNQYVPYIYTIGELKRFFAETDRCQYSSEFPYRHLIMPVIFRMIYMCGLRASEARLLKVSDVDLKQGILTVHQSKNDISRLVPVSDLLLERCRKFSKNLHRHSSAENYYFPALNGKAMTIGNLYKNFRRFLWRARISHGGRGRGPRVHDLRHTYAVHCLKKWTEQKKDLTVYLPVLKTYLGHDSFEETAYYLHLTADVFPNITLRVEMRYPRIIPELGGDDNEAN